MPEGRFFVPLTVIHSGGPIPAGQGTVPLLPLWGFPQADPIGFPPPPPPVLGPNAPGHTGPTPENPSSAGFRNDPTLFPGPVDPIGFYSINRYRCLALYNLYKRGDKMGFSRLGTGKNFIRLPYLRLDASSAITSAAGRSRSASNTSR